MGQQLFQPRIVLRQSFLVAAQKVEIEILAKEQDGDEINSRQVNRGENGNSEKGSETETENKDKNKNKFRNKNKYKTNKKGKIVPDCIVTAELINLENVNNKEPHQFSLLAGFWDTLKNKRNIKKVIKKEKIKT